MEGFQNPLVTTMVEFLASIGIHARPGPVPAGAFVPGIWIEQGQLVIDEAHLRYPGDILHEAGHLAVAVPERRASITGDAGSDPAEEMMAIAWSYAAAVHLNIPPQVVFHDDGYRGGSASIIAGFQSGHSFGIPVLQWLGMTYDIFQAPAHQSAPFPHMLQWMRTVAIPGEAQ